MLYFIRVQRSFTSSGLPLLWLDFHCYVIPFDINPDRSTDYCLQRRENLSNLSQRRGWQFVGAAASLHLRPSDSQLKAGVWKEGAGEWESQTLLWNLGVSFTLAEGLLMKMKTNLPDLEARDMLIHSQISDKTLNHTDALKCQSLKPLELQRWRKKRTILLLNFSNRSIYCTFRYFYNSLGASRCIKNYSSINDTASNQPL